ncbi:PP2C family protein-serine/threonine phosphatase [Symmachiella dynata]|uniref:Phosphoserine phosphatase RsbU n=1 Tax=Symmachiella dynata TaxID=2527995 RepID=A0A517ZNM2_9PLAN|nr:PP2C family protein-serine/threonine phosphatase [Symmachiella dynata]QDU44079.1 Phosphoserine phosphatase RsbU [Symmachiella dynata]
MKNKANDWHERLNIIVETMREMSAQSDPQEMVADYGQRMQQLLPRERMLSLSRRGLKAPQYRITRYSGWSEPVNPWKQRDELPLLESGLLGELLYGGQPRVIDDLQISANDPAAEYLADQHSLVAIPLFDQGEALNMVVLSLSDAHGFEPDELPELVWMSNLFGRATQNLVLSAELRDAYEMVDREMQQVAKIQRSLLPAVLPEIPHLHLAAHYETSQRAGGDYYDFFQLPEGKWGLLIADVSGHGTPAAVMMSIVHSIAHLYPHQPVQASDFLSYINQNLCRRYTNESGSFVTAFYGIYTPEKRQLNYSNAGHCLPLLKHCGAGMVSAIEGARQLPLGVLEDETYTNRSHYLSPGDEIVFYTDGISEATSPEGEMFGTQRLDDVLTYCRHDADEIINELLNNLKEFTHGAPAADDRTVLVAKVT